MWVNLSFAGPRRPIPWKWDHSLKICQESNAKILKNGHFMCPLKAKKYVDVQKVRINCFN